MTVSALYVLYCEAYMAAERLPGGPGEVPCPRCERPTPLERAVAEFAANDAVNGTPCRGSRDFERCLAHGAEALRRLGLRDAALA